MKFVDYFIILPDEVALIWKRRWTLASVVFMISRYLPFIDGSLLLYSECAKFRRRLYADSILSKIFLVSIRPYFLVR